jgi:2-polyprenyl-3-methyl-5-hydroxy-6-metoxy-1,4-benzoquinol methylase
VSEKDKVKKDYWQSVRLAGTDKITLGDCYFHVLRHDTHFLLFSLARYKFAAKMIGQEPQYSMLELGCNEGPGTLLLSEHASRVTGVDFDGDSINWASANLENDRVRFREDNFLGKKYGDFDAVVSLDFIEHILPDNHDLYLQTILTNLTEDNFCIVGTPNVKASPYASKESAEGHVCLYAAQDLKAFSSRDSRMSSSSE